jgi:hypothetical protein
VALMSTTTAATTVPLSAPPTAAISTPTAKMLRASLLLAPLIYLAADCTYAAKGWDDATAGGLHVLGAIAYGFVFLAVAFELPETSRMRALLIFTGLVGMAGNVAYGFDTIHMSLGDVALVDRGGAANLIKPLGLFFPLSLVVLAAALRRLRHPWQAATVLAAGFAWPIAHIGNIAEIAVPVNVALLLALGSYALAQPAPRVDMTREQERP